MKTEEIERRLRVLIKATYKIITNNNPGEMEMPPHIFTRNEWEVTIYHFGDGFNRGNVWLMWKNDAESSIMVYANWGSREMGRNLDFTLYLDTIVYRYRDPAETDILVEQTVKGEWTFKARKQSI